MGCSERTEFANNVILVGSKMSSISGLFILNTRIYVNSICLNITPIIRTLENLLIFSTPTMAKHLEICPFMSAKALKCVMVLEKAIKIYHWTSQGGGGGGGGSLRAWSGFGVAAWPGTVWECCLDLCTSFSGFGCICRDLGNRDVGVYILGQNTQNKLPF